MRERELEQEQKQEQEAGGGGCEEPVVQFIDSPPHSRVNTVGSPIFRERSAAAAAHQL